MNAQTMNTQTTQTNNSLAEYYARDSRGACKKALRLTAKVPENDRLDAINELLGLHGTEAIRGEWQNGYWCDIVAAYCNTGDTYGTTVIQVRGESRYDYSRFFVGNIGDWIDRNQSKYGIQ